MSLDFVFSKLIIQTIDSSAGLYNSDNVFCLLESCTMLREICLILFNPRSQQFYIYIIYQNLINFAYFPSFILRLREFLVQIMDLCQEELEFLIGCKPGNDSSGHVAVRLQPEMFPFLTWLPYNTNNVSCRNMVAVQNRKWILLMLHAAATCEIMFHNALNP